MKELSSVRTRNLLPKCSYRTNVRLARSLWGVLPIIARSRLKELSETYQVSIAAGDLQLFTGIWYITHSGLLRIACRRRCSGIKTTLVSDGSVPALNRWIFKATVYRTRGSTGFVGYGDADPSNVSPLMHGAEMRIAETRAVNRALRKAYGIGLCSVEELGWSPKASEHSQATQTKPSNSNGNGHSNGQSRLRDQLCLLIRKYNLDPNLVKAYAADFCGTETLKGASRELVESFVSHISCSAKEDIDGLICKLNSYSRPVEVKQ